MSGETKILPCPFCGEDPKEVTYNDGFAVKCEFTLCGVQPISEAQAKSIMNKDGKSWHYDRAGAKEKAIKNWNTRKI